MSERSVGTQKRKARMYAILLVGGLLVLLFAAEVPYINKYSTIGSLSQHTNLMLADVLKNPNVFMGQRVKISALVNNTVNTHAMVVDQDEHVMGDEILVVSKNALEPIGGGPSDTLFNQGHNVVVTGTIERFDRQQLEQALGIPLGPDTFSRWNGRPYIAADNIINIQ